MTTRDPERNEIKLLEKFAGFSGARQSVLEIGCGDGRLTWQYAGAADRVVGVEILMDDLRVAKIDRPSDLAEKAVFVNADSIYLPFANEVFDLAILSWSL
ncbi:MAG TPA: class I SAM-dependent methyltransferase [Anaerolineales bacterium]|nr:class I SAM-dependent methyltransferase [Anaerolineales bacterium]